MLASVFSGFELVSDEHGEPLVTHTLRRMQVAEVIEPKRTEAGLLGEFPPSEI